MIEVDQALSLVLQKTRPLAAQSTPVTAAMGLVLAEDVASDVDSPPHDKSLMDGYALIAADVNERYAADPSAKIVLKVNEQVTAGETPRQTVQPGTATKIMTGAPLPDGADAVVMIEKTQPDSAGQPQTVSIEPHSVQAGQNILRRAASLKRGEVVLSSGALLRPLEIGLLSEVGRVDVQTIPRPRLAVLSTGNELVPPGVACAAGQIRNSNGPMLCCLAAHAGAQPINLGIGKDDAEELADLVEQGLQADVLVLSGGVSAGVLDLVPGVLARRGVEQVFHKVRLKPGKPLWFGVLPVEQDESAPPKLVFGLPGNPVSSLVCFQLFVRPALKKLAGHAQVRLPSWSAALDHDHAHHGDRPTYFPAATLGDNDNTSDPHRRVRLVAWKGSADLRSLVDADCLAYLPAGPRTFQSGDKIEVYPL